LQYSLATNQTKLIAHFHPAVLKWITQWNLSPSDQRDLYLLLSQVSQAEKSDSIAFEDLIKYFNTFSAAAAPASETFPPEAVTLATETILRSIQSSTISFSDRRALYTSLSKLTVADSTLLSLIELLRLLVTGDIAGFTAFRSHPEKAALLAAHQVSSEHLLHSLKLLVLCNLAATASASGNALSYDAIAKALEVSEDEVELWVVDAISHRLLEASMDQLNRVVVVK
jgi:translation initiation factor 3 subunit M